MIRQFKNAPAHFVILTAILSIALTTVLTAVLSNRHINKINSDITALSANAQELQEGAGEMRYIVVNTQRLAIIAMLGRNQGTLLKAPAQSSSFYQLVDRTSRLIGDENPVLTARIDALKDGYRDFLFNVIGLAAQYVERTETRENALEQVNFQAHQFLMELNAVAELISQLSKKQVQQIGDYTGTIRWINIVSMATVLAAILVAMFFVEFKLFRPLARLMKFVREIPISNKDLSKRISSNSHDEIGELGKSIDSMLDNLRERTVSVDELKKEVEDRKKAEGALTSIKDELEEEVLRRTKELRTSYEELKSEIMERKQAEEKNAQLQAQLLRTQKMEAVGRLAGGLAHDFNNILTGIIMSSELASMKADSKRQLHKQLCLIQEFGEKGAVLTRQLLTFSRQQVVKPILLNVNILVSGMLKMLRRLIGENIRLTFQEEMDIQRIKADPGQIEQILMNLVVNARDAINEVDMKKEGAIRIETRMIHLTNEPIVLSSGIRPGDYAQLSVTDTGRGMDPETQARIFEPFFTTKPVGKGTGLGLSTVYGIVKNYRGAIEIESEPHKGARIKVLLPAVSDNEAAEIETDALSVASPGDKYKGTPLELMLIEDEDSVRESIQSVLNKMGHRVHGFSDPMEAEKKFHEAAGTIDLIVSDVIMPGCDGPELYSRLLRHSPLLKVLFISGYADHHIPQNMAKSGQTLFLQKPFTMEQLDRAIHHLMRGLKDRNKNYFEIQEEMLVAV